MKHGDYVLATKYSDGDPGDQFCIGFYAGPNLGHPDRHDIIDKQGVLFRANGFRRVEKLTGKRGNALVRIFEVIEASGKSLWWWKHQSYATMRSMEPIADAWHRQSEATIKQRGVPDAR